MIPDNISDKDCRLLGYARSLHYRDWQECLDMAKEAESEDVQKAIRGIGISLYHTEEYIVDHGDCC